jgi:hypothetical protein
MASFSYMINALLRHVCWLLIPRPKTLLNFFFLYTNDDDECALTGLLGTLTVRLSLGVLMVTLPTSFYSAIASTPSPF